MGGGEENVCKGPGVARGAQSSRTAGGNDAFMPRDLRFTFLGTGTSAGVPAIGCACAVCTSADPRDQRLRAGAAVQWTDPQGRERVVLIDATPDLRQQALRARLTRCDAILFTHNHVDHTFGLDEVRRFNVLQHAPVSIYAEDHTMGHLRRVYQHIFEREQNVNDSFVATLIPHRLAPAVPVDLYGVRFTPIRLLHGRLPVLGFRIEVASEGLFEQSESGVGQASGLPGEISVAQASRLPSSPAAFPLAYCTDCSAIPPESYPLLRGLGTLVLDGLRYRKHPTHFSINEACGVAERVGAGVTYLTHLAHDVGHAEGEAKLPEGVRLAWDGLIIQ